MKNYKFLLKDDSILNLLNSSNLKIKEIGDGNLNFVFKISNNKKNTYAIKHAKPYLKILGKDFKLTTNRIIAEMNSMEYFNTICPKYVPKIYIKNEKKHFFLMEYLKHYKPLRKRKTNHKVYKKLGSFLFKVATNTPKKNSYYECEQLKQITKNYVFEYPFIKDHKSLVILSYFPQKKFSNDFLKNLEYLKNIFLNSKSSLIHGDLHTDSIMVKNNDIAIIDSEFSLYSEISFDIGNILAHTLFSSISFENKLYEKKIRQLFKKLKELNNFKKILQHSIGFCAIEMARRLYVPAKSKDLEKIKSLKKKKNAYNLSFNIANDIGSNMNKFNNVDSFLKRLDKWL